MAAIFKKDELGIWFVFLSEVNLESVFVVVLTTFNPAYFWAWVTAEANAGMPTPDYILLTWFATWRDIARHAAQIGASDWLAIAFVVALLFARLARISTDFIAFRMITLDFTFLVAGRALLIALVLARVIAG